MKALGFFHEPANKFELKTPLPNAVPIAAVNPIAKALQIVGPQVSIGTAGVSDHLSMSVRDEAATAKVDSSVSTS